MKRRRKKTVCIVAFLCSWIGSTLDAHAQQSPQFQECVIVTQTGSVSGLEARAIVNSPNECAGAVWLSPGPAGPIGNQILLAVSANDSGAPGTEASAFVSHSIDKIRTKGSYTCLNE